MKNAQNRLDNEFSKYVRINSADDNGDCKCITCGKKEYWKEVDAGHFIGRRHLATRWKENNVHPQCHSCNRFNAGKPAVYEEKIIYLYGQETLDELIKLRHSTVKFTKAEINGLAKEYSEKSKLIAKEKGIQL